MKSLLRKLIYLVILAIALLILNPSLKKHQDKIIEKYKEQNPLTGVLGAGELIRQTVSRDNYYFFSVGKISPGKKSVSFGIAGFVIVYGDLDLDNLKEMVPEFGN